MPDIVQKDDAKEVFVKTTDGALWQAEINEDGQLILVTQIAPPPPSPSGASESEEEAPAPEPEAEEEEAEAKPEPMPEPKEPAEEEPEESEAQPQPNPSESEQEADEEPPTPPPPSMFEEMEEPEDTLEQLLKEFAKKQPQTKPPEERNDQPDEVQPIPDHIKDSLDDHAFRSRLSSIMLDNKYDRRLKGRTRGKLDMTKLFKVPTQSRSVFTQKQARRGKQYNVLLLVDESGSMHGSKAQEAARSAVFLAKNFEGININVAIIGFNHYVTVRKGFTQPCDYDRVYGAISSCNFYQGDSHNNDYDALNRAYRMFDRAPEGQNILIMLSDGMPASDGSPTYVDIRGRTEHPIKNPPNLEYYQKNERTHLHHLVKANSHVTSIGIGIYEGGWQVPKHFVINDVAQLKKSIINTLRSEIKRG